MRRAVWHRCTCLFLSHLASWRAGAKIRSLWDSEVRGRLAQNTPFSTVWALLPKELSSKEWNIYEAPFTYRHREGRLTWSHFLHVVPVRLSAFYRLTVTLWPSAVSGRFVPGITSEGFRCLWGWASSLISSEWKTLWVWGSVGLEGLEREFLGSVLGTEDGFSHTLHIE